MGKVKKFRLFIDNYIKGLDLTYKNNNKFWMFLAMINECFNNLNKKFKTEDRNVLLLLDNTPIQPVNTEFSNLTLYYFPPNVTFLIQPLDRE